MATFIKQPLTDGGEVILNLEFVEYVRKEPTGTGEFVYTLKTTALPFPVAITSEIYQAYSALIPVVG